MSLQLPTALGPYELQLIIDRSRAENLARATSLESQGRQKEARDYYTKCVDITPEMAYQLIKVS